MKIFHPVLFISLLFTVGGSPAHPFSGENQAAGTSTVKADSATNTTASSQIQEKPDKLRQEGEGDGDGADGDGDNQFQQVGAQVGQIITGVLGGNIGGIFGGATSFIQEEDTKSGVGNILSSIAKPFNQLLITGVMQGQKFFGITDPPSILLAATSPAPPSSTVETTDVVVSPSELAVQPAAVQSLRTTAAPVPLAPKGSAEEDDDDELRTLVSS